MRCRKDAGLSMAMRDAGDGAEMSRARSEGSGRKPREQDAGASSATAGSTARPEAEVRRVAAHEGAPDVDGLPVEQLRAHLVTQWPRIREALLAGRYRPAPVRGVEIPKPGGGVRLLGIPTVVDRLIQ